MKFLYFQKTIIAILISIILSGCVDDTSRPINEIDFHIGNYLVSFKPNFKYTIDVRTEDKAYVGIIECNNKYGRGKIENLYGDEIEIFTEWIDYDELEGYDEAGNQYDLIANSNEKSIHSKKSNKFITKNPIPKNFVMEHHYAGEVIKKRNFAINNMMIMSFDNGNSPNDALTYYKLINKANIFEVENLVNQVETAKLLSNKEKNLIKEYYYKDSLNYFTSKDYTFNITNEIFFIRRKDYSLQQAKLRTNK